MMQRKYLKSSLLKSYAYNEVKLTRKNPLPRSEDLKRKEAMMGHGSGEMGFILRTCLGPG